MHGRILVALACAASLAIPAVALADVPVSVGSNPSPFPQNKQNEPTVAIDPNNPSIVIGGSNDEIDEPDCNGADCPFVQGIGNTGVYWSTNGGGSWTQPDYSGFSARTGPGGTEGDLGTGLIGTLPKYDSAGLTSDGDPAVAWGPAPDENGHFDWNNGERAYFANLTANFSSVRSDEAFKGFEAIAVSHTVDLQRAIDGHNDGWSAPAIVSQARQSSSTFSDKEAVWADNAATSQFFGRVYVCWTDFRSNTADKGNAPIMTSYSTDGGNTWSRGNQLTAAVNNHLKGRQGCDMRTDSNGNLFLFDSDNSSNSEAIKVFESADGGKTFAKPVVITHEVNPGGPSVVRPGENDDIDGVAGSRTDDFPHVTIANGAPTGEGASNKLALAWDDATDGLNFEHIKLKLSSDGTNWTDAQNIEEAGDRPAMPSVALSPDGKDLYLVYNAFLNPFRDTVGPVSISDDDHSRRFQAVVRHADVTGTSIGGLSTMMRGGIGDGRSSSANALIDEFLGDYNMVSATNDGAVAVYITGENADQCQAINDYRDSLVNQVEEGTDPIDAPAPNTDCGENNRFGNTDINGYAPVDPTDDSTSSSLRPTRTRSKH
jgi:hypothetical protein